MKKPVQQSQSATIIRNLATRSGFFVTGALVLTVFSILQKFLVGGPATGMVFVVRAYVVPVVYGGITGLIIGEWYLRLRSNSQQIQESEERLRTLIDAMPDFVIFKDGSGRWQDVNDASRSLFKFPTSQYRGKTDLELAKENIPLEEMLQWCHFTDEQTWDGNKIKQCAVEGLPTENGLRTFDVVKVPLFWPNGDRKGLVTIGRDITQLKLSEQKLAQAYDYTLEGWAKAIELRDQITNDHTSRVVDLSESLARLSGIHQDDLEHVRRGALLHDIGKICIPDAILGKPGVLTEEEWEVMHRHPVTAYEMLAHIEFLDKALVIPYCHHEHWDGSGYPRGLNGDQIPLMARVFTIVDVWDALTSDRPYRSAWTPEKAIAYIQAQSGKLFDPTLVPLFLQLITQ